MPGDEDVVGFVEPATKTIGLCMIVKNEAAVIERCLDSVRPLIDYVLIEDTGSTDGTQDLIRAYLRRHGIAGQVIEEKWRDFAYNRSHVMARLHKNKAVDYALIMDADDSVICEQDFDVAKFKGQLSLDEYSVEIREPGAHYSRPQLYRNNLAYRYRGVVHEFLESPPGASSGRASGFHIASRREGARSRDPNKYRNDAELLDHALAHETDAFMRARYTFYLAQSWRDCGEHAKALAAYLDRAGQGGWDQEVFISLYNAGKLQGMLGAPVETVVATLQRATDVVPTRVEALHAASRACRLAGRNQLGYEVARRGLDVPEPESALFLEPWVYQYGLLDEFSINAYWAGKYYESLEACLRLLGQNKFPPHERDRLYGNSRFAIDKLKDTDPAALDLLIASAGAAPPPLALPKAPDRAPGSPLPPVSVITPTGGRAAFLMRSLEHFRSQDYPHLEWLILDDSPEPNRAFLDLREPNIHYRHHAGPRLTIGEKRNRLVELATGKIIVHFDDDDYYAPHYIKRMVDGLLENDADLINLRGWHLFDQRSNFFGYWDLMKKEGLHYRCDPAGISVLLLNPDNNQEFADNHLGFGFSFAYKKAAWRKCKFPDKDFNEDGEFALQVAAQGKVCGIHDTNSCLHLLHTGSTSRCYSQYRLPDFELARKFPGFLRDLPTTGESAPPNAATTPRSRRAAVLPGRPVFIHANWRTSSTWFWGRFRRAPQTLCYFEPFAELIPRLFPKNVPGNLLYWGPADWQSHHPAADPYFLEYLPLLRRAGGVRLYDERMAFDWSMPVGGLDGSLRDAERRYISLLLRHAARREKIPVFGFVRTVGRIRAIKNTFDGFHIFQYRNLWRHWCSYLAYKQEGTPYFYDTVAIVAARSSEDPFIDSLCSSYIRRHTGKDQLPKTLSEKRKILSSLSELETFNLFMELYLYLYLHAHVTADATVDVTQLARDDHYRQTIEDELSRHTKLPITFSDAADTQKPVDFDLSAVDWDGIKASALKAVSELSAFGDRRVLSAFADELVNTAYIDAQSSQGEPAAPPGAASPDKPTLHRNPAEAAGVKVPVASNQMPTAYLINMDRSTDRLRHFKEANSHFSNFVRAPGVDGHKLDRAELVRSKYINEEVSYGPGTLGCALSHIKLWELAASENRAITIFEDDIIISHEFENQSRRILASLPHDWDIIKWGYLFPPSFVWVDLGVSKARLEGYGPYQYRNFAEQKKFQIDDSFRAALRMMHSFGFQGYSISAKGARAALEICLPLRRRMIEFPQAGVVTEDIGIDVALSGSFPNMKAFLCAPPLVIHRSDFESAREATDKAEAVTA